MSMGIILLAGGKGTRMGTSIPKVFCTLGDRPLALHSFSVLVNLTACSEIVVVAPEEYHSLFSCREKSLRFASPGRERQDSVYHGLSLLSSGCEAVLVHDAARPFIDEELIARIVKKGREVGAVAPGLPLTSTIRTCDPDGRRIDTPPRGCLYEIQTPQYIRLDWLREGLERAQSLEVTLTDDIAAAELLGHATFVVQGDLRNRKITHPEDMAYAQFLLQSF